MNTASNKQRRSLKGAWRTILLKCRRQASDEASNEVTCTVGSGILRKEPSIPALSGDSTTAFLLGLDSNQYDDENDGNDIPDRFDISSLATSAAMSSTRTLMPKMSLNDFAAYHLPVQEAAYLQRGRRNSVSSSLIEGASHQASLSSLRSFRSGSTLRIQGSHQTLIPISEFGEQSSFPERIDDIFDQIHQSGGEFHCPSPPSMHHALSPKRSLLRRRASTIGVTSPTLSNQAPQPLAEHGLTEQLYRLPYDYSRRFSRPLSVIEEVASYVDEVSTPRQSPVPRASYRQASPSSQVSDRSILRAVSATSDSTNPLLSVKHFSSFCALDTVTPGCPVTATSKDLSYIFEIGESFCLNNQGCEDVPIDIITGSDAAGNPVTHLVLFTPLIIPHSGRSRFMLASLIDVTEFIHDTASLPELESLSEESTDSDPPTPRYKPQVSPKTPKYQLSAESLLGGCFLDDVQTPIRKYDEDIWLNLATEERKQGSQRSKTSSVTRTSTCAASTLSSIDAFLDNFMCKLQELHSEFFLLAKSPLDDNYYEICNVSPKVYEDRDYVNGHLSKTSAADMVKLSSQLAGNEAFDMNVLWGTHGVPKHLYCIPLFARSAVTWICFLVEAGMPILW